MSGINTNKTGKSDLDMIEQLPTLSAAAGSYRAASTDDRSLRGWMPAQSSANAALEGELGLMMARSRDLSRNNGIAAGAEQTQKDNIVGATLRLVAKPNWLLLGQSADWAHDWARHTQAHFMTWADTLECDAGRSLNLLGLTLQMLGGAFGNGDGLALPVWKPRPGARWNTRLHVVEADRLSTPFGQELNPRISGGVHSDSHGEPLGYFIMKNHPGDFWGLRGLGPTAWEYVPAFTDWGRRRVIHLHDKARPGQSRAAPLIKAVMREFSQVGQWTHTELQTAITNSLIAGVLESDLDPETIHGIFATGNDAETKYDRLAGGMRSRLESGAVLRMPIGTRFTPIDSGRNTSGMDTFLDKLFHWIAAGLNMPYELLLKDFSKTNYSSARAALLEAWRYFNGRRRWLTDYWLNEVYALWLEEAINAGVIDAPGYYDNRAAYQRCRWIMAGRGWVDPVKEAIAAKMRMEMRLTTFEQECAEQGFDWEENLEQAAYEARRLRELGLSAPEALAVSRETQTNNDDDEQSMEGDDAQDRDDDTTDGGRDGD